MVAASRPLGQRLTSLVWAHGLSPQFAPQAWRLGGFFAVAVITYAVFLWSVWPAWIGLWLLGAIVPAFDRVPEASKMMLMVAFRALATVGTALWLCQLLPATSASFGFVRPRLSHLWCAAGAWLVTFLAAWALPVRVDSSDPAYRASAAAFYSHHTGALAYFSDIIDSAVATPIVEETMFRGLLFAALVQWLPAWLAALISSLIFAMWHQEPYRIVPLTIMGLGMAYIYYRSGTLWAPIAAHAFNNWLVVSVTYLAGIGLH
jgi:membrane protease YdiL (CAAX protease family)